MALYLSYLVFVKNRTPIDFVKIVSYFIHIMHLLCILLLVIYLSLIDVLKHVDTFTNYAVVHVMYLFIKMGGLHTLRLLVTLLGTVVILS